MPTPGRFSLTVRRLRTMRDAVERSIFATQAEVRGITRKRQVRELFEARDWIDQELAERAERKALHRQATIQDPEKPALASGDDDGR